MMLVFSLNKNISGTWIWFPLWFHGLLHMDVIQERLEREFEQTLS